MDYLNSKEGQFPLSSDDKFIITYKAALEVGLGREQLASYLGLIPDSLMRKRLKLYDRTGVELPIIDLIGEKNIPVDILDRFETAIETFERNNIPERINTYKLNRRYVITSAQNATPVNTKFLKALENYCKINDAELLIIPLRYKNPTSIWSSVSKEHEWWHPDIMEYIDDSSRKLGKSIEYMGHMKIQPTAVGPTTGFESYTGTSSAVFGHPKIEMKYIATPSKNLPKILTTTGSITLKNFTDSKAGHKGAFHHSYAAVIVEVDGKDHHHIRHIHWNEEKGGFYDLESFYGQNSHKTGIRIAGLVQGDSHVQFMDEGVENATFKHKDSLCNLLRPEYLIWHDVEDFYTRMHHHRGNDVIAYGKHHFGRNNVEEGLQITANFIDKYSHPDTKNVIVKSNHDEAFDRWLRETDIKSDPENARFYYYMKYNQMCNIRMTETGFSSIDPFAWWCANPDEQKGLQNIDNTIFLERDQSFVIRDIEVAFHGDRGTNGTRASIVSFSKIGPKVIIGHSHTPGIKEGAYQVGMSAKLNLEYQSGPSSWMHTHAIIYQDGSRTLINIIDGEYRGNF